MKTDTDYDVVIAGGGPAGLSAALALGRGRKRVLVCDAGSPRNAAAVHLHNFVTRDGIAPAEFRRIARQQLEVYPAVKTNGTQIEGIRGERGAFEVHMSKESVTARRILLCTGMVDEMSDLEGFRELWGKSIFQCPYCHAWEIQDQRFAYLAASVEALQFALLLRGWTSDVVVLTDDRFEVPPETGRDLASAGVRIEPRRISRLTASEDRLDRIEFAGGDWLRRDALFAHPRQQQTAFVRSLGLATDALGFVTVDEVSRETSIPGIYAGGDLLSPVQGALIAAESGVRAAARLNHELTLELATTGALL